MTGSSYEKVINPGSISFFYKASLLLVLFSLGTYFISL